MCRSDRLGQEDALVTTRTHLGSLLHPGDTVLGYDLSCAVLNDDDVKPMQVGERRGVKRRDARCRTWCWCASATRTTDA